MEIPAWLTQLATVSGAVIALLTLAKGVLEYTRQNALKRAEHFFRIRDQLKSNVTFKDICALLETYDPKIMEYSFADRRDFLGFFEEVAISLNSGLIRPAVAHYMFGYYAIRCKSSKNFWFDINRNSVYWSLFGKFADRMAEMEVKSSYRPGSYRF